MPDLIEMSDGANENIIMYRWAFGGKAATLAELRVNFAPGQDRCAYIVGKDAYAWDDVSADFILVGQWQGPIGPAGEGVPLGGAAGQVLIKSGNADFETVWAELTLKTNAPLSGGGRVTDSLTLNIADATTTKRGVVRIATSAETTAGIKDDVAISPIRLKELLDTIRADLAAINSMPVGTVFEFAEETPPEGALVGDGSLAPIADFPELFAVIGYAHTPDWKIPSFGYFYLPDYRDKFLRGHNPNGGRKFGSEQGDAIRNITGTAQVRSELGFFNSTMVPVTGAFKIGGKIASNGQVGIVTGNPSYSLGLDVGLVVPTATENRPVNKTVLICIKY